MNLFLNQPTTSSLLGSGKLFPVTLLKVRSTQTPLESQHEARQVSQFPQRFQLALRGCGEEGAGANPGARFSGQQVHPPAHPPDQERGVLKRNRTHTEEGAG